ncbi:hypothetical protein [Elizabethkingia meningoseptica]|uniref:hypothetical protein n=1 Tax=Elizabethkingia meningoseptica TaxID=238 RepID=UPI002DD6B1F9|nr:hypothetical protein [Elizabethkingia meningoseptica]MEC4711754.1 hypothetical protein [Elizabethkingia meningoseptica]
MKIKEQGYFLLFLFIYAIVAAQNSRLPISLQLRMYTQKRKLFFWISSAMSLFSDMISEETQIL